MGLRRFIRKIIPREIRDNPVLAIAAVALVGPAALGAIGASTATLVGATVAANTATAIAIGTGVVTAGVTFAQTGDVSDSLKAGVRAGVGSAVGSAVSSSVTNAVAGQTGASLADLEPALRELPSQAGIGQSIAGAASITAGNIAGQAAKSAITGQPLEQALLFGAAQSIPTALSVSQDFRSLSPIVQNMLASSAQAAVMGQDVGDAAIASLVASSGIVARAINEIPGGQEFIQNNPVYAKYVIDSVSSALTAQLQGKDVSESVIYSLARTTADVLSQEFQNTEKSQAVAESNQKYTQAQQEEQNVARLGEQLNAVQQKHAYALDAYTRTAETLNSYIQTAQGYAATAQAYIDMLNDPGFDRTYQQNAAAQRESLIGWINYYNNLTRQENEYIQNYQKEFKDAERLLNRSGFFEEFNPIRTEYEQAVNRLNGLVAEIQDDAATLAQASSDLFTDFETELATTLAPLTAFEDVTNVGDQDLLAEIQPVAPPSPEIGVEVAGPVSPDILGRLQSMPLFGETVYRETETPAEPGSISGTMNMRFIEGFRTDGTPYYYAIATFEDGSVRYVAYQDGEPTIFDNRPDLKTSSGGIGDVAVDAEVSGDGQGTVGAGTGTPGAPPIDYSLAATEMQGTPLGEQPPFPTIGLNLLTAGTGIEGGRNRALFNTGGGFGSGGNTTETTWSIVARASETGTNDIVDVGGKLYSLILLPDKQVLVPEEPSEVVVYVERDLTTDLPRMREVPASSVPPQEAQQIAEKVGQTAGGAPAGAEGATGGRTAEEERVATTEEQLQPGARPEEVAPGVVAEQPAPSFPELVSGITEPTVPAFVPGQAAGTQTGTQPPGAAGVGDEITDEDIIRLIQGEIGIPGGGEGEGAPGEEGAGVGEGEEGVGPGAGEEGEGEGVAGEGEGTGEGVGPGTGEGGGEVTPSPDILLPTARVTTVGRRTFQRPGEAAPYRVTGMDESGILGRKQPLFGGDEDLQRAEWNRRSLRLKRLLGL